MSVTETKMSMFKYKMEFSLREEQQNHEPLEKNQRPTCLNLFLVVTFLLYIINVSCNQGCAQRCINRLFTNYDVIPS